MNEPPAALTPPIAAKKPHTQEAHGTTWEDPYYWLRERESEEVLTYLRNENAYTAAKTKHLKDSEDKIYKEVWDRIEETDLSVPYRKGDYWYYSRTEEGKDYPIYCRKKGSLKAKEEIIFDQNERSKGHEYYKIGTFSLSPDHNLLAFAVDTSGYEKFVLRFLDLRTGELSDEAIDEVSYGGTWSTDNKTFFYVRIDEANRPCRLFRHELGSAPASDSLIYEEKDERFFLGIDRTLDDAFLIMDLNSKVTSEVWVLPADKPMDAFEVLVPRRHKIEYSVDHHTDQFFILTNDQALNFRVVTLPDSARKRTDWKEYVAHNPNVMLEDVSMFREYMVISERRDGLPSLRVRHLKSGDEHVVEVPEPTYSLYEDVNASFDSTQLRFGYASMVTPRSVFDYDMATRERILLKETKVLGEYDRTQYKTERLHARGHDGTSIPISVVYRSDVRLDGAAPLYLQGYGSYGHSYDAYFSAARLSLLERGVIVAIAHIRGGGENGRKWYEDGKFKNKLNTFKDFISCAEHLIEHKYTSSQRLAVQGGSAGGLLMGTVLNMRPDLFKIAIADVPFVDVINTMLDASIPLTVIEYDEWGDPNEKGYFEYMQSYSPYDNVSEQAYPHILVTAGLNDPRVQYWEPAKWVAKLRQQKTDDNELLLKTNMGAGHGGASGRYERVREIAFEFAFVLEKLGAL